MYELAAVCIPNLGCRWPRGRDRGRCPGRHDLPQPNLFSVRFSSIRRSNTFRRGAVWMAVARREVPRTLSPSSQGALAAETTVPRSEQASRMRPSNRPGFDLNLITAAPEDCSTSMAQKHPSSGGQRPANTRAWALAGASPHAGSCGKCVGSIGKETGDSPASSPSSG